MDDDILVLDYLALTIQEAGYAATRVHTAGEAIDLIEARAGGFHAVITDVNLGRGQPSGWDIGERARELRPDIPVVYITGDSAHEWSRRGVPRSVLVQKPFEPVQLMAVLAALRSPPPAGAVSPEDSPD